MFVLQITYIDTKGKTRCLISRQVFKLHGSEIGSWKPRDQYVSELLASLEVLLLKRQERLKSLLSSEMEVEDTERDIQSLKEKIDWLKEGGKFPGK